MRKAWCLLDNWLWVLIFVVSPTNQTSMAQGFLKVGPGAAPKPTQDQQFQKCLEPRRHSPRERRQAINPTSPERIRSWEDGSLRLKDVGISSETRMLCLSSTRVKLLQPISTKPRHIRPDLRTREHSKPKPFCTENGIERAITLHVIPHSETSACEAFCFDVAQGWMNGAHSWRFAALAC